MAARPKASLRPGQGGEPAVLELERPLAASLTPGQPLVAHFHSSEGVVLLREPAALGGFFAGSLSSLSVEEVLGHVVSGIRSGQLTLQNGPVQRTVTFRDGQPTFAVSSVHHERLGSVVVQLGLVTPEQLHLALGKVTPSLRIGAVLTREGFLSEANLYSAMTYLVREVMLNLFEMAEGSFLFLEGRQPPGDQVKLQERTRDLVIQGLKRGEAVARLRRRFPDELMVTTGAEAPPPGEESLFAQAAPGTSLGALRSFWEGSLFSFLTWVEERMRDGALVIQLRTTVPAVAPVAPMPRRASGTFAAIPPPVVAPMSPEERFNSLLAQIHTAIRLAGANPDLLRGFLESPQPGLEAAYEGVTLGPDGRLDVERIRSNVSSGGEALARAMTLEALDAFVSYALFSARNVLPGEMSERLYRGYRDLQEGLS
ncbi:hypothetical protein D187_003262 [Cystobacter fuscus DSM 2262]|uniref:PatA-like N-terminal domain-containing protein n=1 Tax=Cystobacter fuscus (strain ATCC 25194 / DSM 2262 / NBRC 100088 / M29) TaxID=1242864 RepID=S9PNE3_CYSF2|nr:DUF4388 domain-containing protein [Cystobacter fuscus]EPX64526.1 hypothetical protein D187_003262 [Cystobacter fuscus DSM 2262]